VNIRNFEIQRSAVRASRRTLANILPTSAATVRQCNILSESLGRSYGSLHVAYIVSETISRRTPAFRVEESGVVFTGSGAFDSQLSDLRTDPFPLALDCLLKSNSSFYSAISSGRTALWPNPIDGSYKPNGHRSEMLLTSNPNPLHYRLNVMHIPEFGDYQPIAKEALRF